MGAATKIITTINTIGKSERVASAKPLMSFVRLELRAGFNTEVNAFIIVLKINIKNKLPITNKTIVIQEINELGVKAEFRLEETQSISV